MAGPRPGAQHRGSFDSAGLPSNVRRRASSSAARASASCRATTSRAMRSSASRCRASASSSRASSDSRWVRRSCPVAGSCNRRGTGDGSTAAPGSPRSGPDDDGRGVQSVHGHRPVRSVRRSSAPRPEGRRRGANAPIGVGARLSAHHAAVTVAHRASAPRCAMCRPSSIAHTVSGSNSSRHDHSRRVRCWRLYSRVNPIAPCTW